MKKYDVIIVNYNGEKIIAECLDSIYHSSIQPCKVIIYDNHSSDRSLEIIKQRYPRVILIEGETNLGFGRANNEAMEYSDSDFILFVNNDLILEKDCSKVLLDSFNDPSQAIINPLIYKGWDKNDKKEIYSFGAEMNISGFGYSLYDSYQDRDDLSCFSGACFMARSAIIKNVKFERKFFLYYEEPDISVKVLMRNYRICRRLKAECYHLENYSSPKKKTDGICFRQYYAIQNRWYMLGKYWPTKYLAIAMPLNIFHLFYNAIFFLKNGQLDKLKIIYLSFRSLGCGRRHKSFQENNSWMKHLSSTSLFKILGLKEKVYK